MSYHHGLDQIISNYMQSNVSILSSKFVFYIRTLSCSWSFLLDLFTRPVLIYQICAIVSESLAHLSMTNDSHHIVHSFYAKSQFIWHTWIMGSTL